MNPITLPLYRQDLQDYMDLVRKNVEPNNPKKRKRSNTTDVDLDFQENASKKICTEATHDLICLSQFGKEKVLCPRPVAVSIMSLKFKSWLESKVDYPDYITHVTNAYHRHIAKNLIGEDILCELLAFWIYSKRHYLSIGVPLVDIIEKDILEGSVISPLWNKQDFKHAREIYLSENGKQHLKAFFEDVANFASQHRVKPIRKKVVILTDRNGGAHLSIAKSIKAALKKENYHPKILKLHRVYQKNDPLARAGMVFGDGTPVTVAEVSQRFSIMQNKEPLDTEIRSWTCLLRETTNTESSDYDLPAVVKKVQELRPSLIINTLPYNPHTILPHLLNVPMFIPQADFDFHKECRKIYNVQEWLPAGQRRITFGIPDAHVKDKELLHDDDSIHIVGYPTRPIFNTGASEVMMKALIEKYRIPENEKMLVIMMGRMPSTQYLVSAVSQLAERECLLGEKLQIFVICGENETAKTQIMEITSQSSQSKTKTFYVLGLTDADETASLLTLTASRNGVLWTKAGGSTVGEAIKLRLKLLIFAGYDWENHNKEYAIEMGFGKEITRNEHGWYNLKDVLQEALKMPRPTINALDSDKLMVETVEKVIKASESFVLS